MNATDKPTPEQYHAAAAYTWGNTREGSRIVVALAAAAAAHDAGQPMPPVPMDEKHVASYVARVCEVAEGFRRMGAILHRPVWFPDVRDFAELFPEARRWTDADLQARHNGPVHYCVTTSARSVGNGLAVSPSQALRDRMRADLLDISNDSKHFELIDHANGRTLVVVSYGQIIGSHYVAYLDTATLPTLPATEGR